MSDEEVDEELVQLQEMKGKLLGKAIELRNQLADWERDESDYFGRTKEDFLPTRNEFHELITLNEDVTRVDKKCVAITSFMNGMKFTAVDKKWSHEHKYFYSAHVKTKVLEFDLEVTVDTQNEDGGSEILDIDSTFLNVQMCYSLEITPWVRRFTESKDMSKLFSVISDYTDHNVKRTKILQKLQEYYIASIREYTEDDGGVLILLHSKNDTDFVYFEIRWVLRFVESLWGIDNSFVIQPISAGDSFLRANQQLLQDFCKYKIKQVDLQDLWQKLASAVEQDDALETMTETTE